MPFSGIKQLPASCRHLIGMTIFRFPVEKKKYSHKKLLNMNAEESFLLFTVEA